MSAMNDRTSILRRVPWLGMMCVVAVSVWIGWGPLSGRAALVGGDTGHFYGPVWRWMHREWASGRVPLWNPYENLGAPLVASGTAAAFYPGQLLFALPLEFDRALAWFVVGHLWLAAAATYGLARHWDASRSGAALAGMSYALGGTVLAQHANLVFLVGAAWLPLALWAADRAIADRSLAGAVLLGVTLALVVLGGDPQMAYHVLLLVGIGVWINRRFAPLLDDDSGPPRPVGVGMGINRRIAANDASGTARAAAARRPRSVGRLALAVLIAAGLSAIQWLPSFQFSRFSDRALFDAPRSIWEFPEYWARPPRTGGAASFVPLDVAPLLPAAEPWYGGLLARPSDGRSHRARIYQFSVEPWRLPEYFIPGCYGRPGPDHRRWLTAIGREGLLWVPSLYMGTATILAALASWSLVRRRTHVAWLWCALVGATLASWGHYGLAYLAQLLAPQRLAGLEPAVGGVYWWLVALLPGYVEFRYPAKWLVVAALTLSVLAAIGWDRLRGLAPHDPASEPAAPRPDRPRGEQSGPQAGPKTGGAFPRKRSGADERQNSGTRGRRRSIHLAALPALVLAVAAGTGSMLATGARPWLVDWLQTSATARPPDRLQSRLGPLDAPGAVGDLAAGLLHVAVVAGAIAYLLSNRDRSRTRWAGCALVVLAAADLAWAARGSLPTASTAHVSPAREPLPAAPGQRALRPSDHRPDETTGLPAIERRGQSSDEPRRRRHYRAPVWQPSNWSERPPRPFWEGATQWERQTLLPQYHLDAGVGLLVAPTTMVSGDWKVVVDEGRRLAITSAPESTARLLYRPLLDLWGAATWIVPDDAPVHRELKRAFGATSPLWTSAPLADDALVVESPLAYPRAWLVHHGDVFAAEPTRDPAVLRERTYRTLFRAVTAHDESAFDPAAHAPAAHNQAALDQAALDQAAHGALTSDDGPLRPAARDGDHRDVNVLPRDWRREVVLEVSHSQLPQWSERLAALAAGAKRDAPPDGAPCRLVRDDPCLVIVEAEPSQPGLLVLADLYADGWQAELSWGDEPPRPAPIVRANRVLRGVWLPRSGPCRVVLRYRPGGVVVGAVISLASAALLLATCCVRRRRSIRPSTPSGVSHRR